MLNKKKAIKEVDSIKYLGIIIDAKLTFKPHINEVSKKVARGIGVLYKLRPFVSQKILINFYYAIIYPFLLYGILIWGSASTYLLNPLLVLQKKFVRLSTYNDNYPSIPGPLAHTPPLFKKLNLLNIFDIYKLQLGKLVFESVSGIGPMNTLIQFQNISQVHNYNTRLASSGNIYITRARTTRFGLKSLRIAGAKLWNSLPMDVKSAASKFILKKKLKSMFINNYH